MSFADRGKRMEEKLTEITRRRAIGTALVGCAATGLQASAAASSFRPSASEQKKLGDEAAKQTLDKYKLVKSERADRFARVGHALVAALPEKDRKAWDYSFQVVESKEINAFALPGGHMFLFSGLLEKMTSDSQIAAVTGHELTHVRKEHWAKAVEQQRERQVGIGLLLNIFRLGKSARQIAGGVEGIVSLQYSRKEEDEADAQGLVNMVDAKYDPQGMIQLFELLQKANSGGDSVPTFLRDHPLTKDRIRKTRERIDKLNGVQQSEG